MIETKTYSLSQEDYTKIVMLTRLKKSWWLYVLMFIIGFIHLKDFGSNEFSTFVCVFSLLYPFLIFIYLYFWSKSKDNQPIFDDVSMCFDEDYMYFQSNENESKLTPNSIQKVINHKKYWLLYISKGQFIHVPKNIFHSEVDFESFKKLIKHNN